MDHDDVAPPAGIEPTPCRLEDGFPVHRQGHSNDKEVGRRVGEAGVEPALSGVPAGLPPPGPRRVVHLSFVAESGVGVEPTMGLLQSPALPLGYLDVG